jgi:hypothetical protein
VTTRKQLRSKPAAKKKAVTLDDLEAQLNQIRQQVAYCVVQLGFNLQQEPHPIVQEALKTADLREYFSENGEGEGNQQ